MRLPEFKHIRPATLDQACTILAESNGMSTIVAGGTDLFVRMKQGISAPDQVIDIKGIAELKRIAEVDDKLKIGAAVTLGELHRSPLVQEYAAPLAETALAVGAAQLQNMGTIGGNLCLATRCWYYQQSQVWRQVRPPCFKTGGEQCHMAGKSKRCYALYSGDTAAALLVLGASVRILSASADRTLPLVDFFVDDGVRNTILQPGEIITAITVPAQPSGQRATYLKYRKRGAIDYPIVGVAAALAEEKGVCQSLRIAVTGVSSKPFLVKGVGELAENQPVSADLFESLAEMAWKQTRPVSNMEVSPSHRKQLVRVLTKDSLNYLAGLEKPEPITCRRNQ